jgi:hypothetical protein
MIAHQGKRSRRKEEKTGIISLSPMKSSLGWGKASWATGSLSAVGLPTRREQRQTTKIAGNKIAGNKKGESLDSPFSSPPSRADLFGRRDWTRTNDPHHVKVVL